MTYAIAFFVAMVVIAVVVHLVLERSKEQDEVFEEMDRREEKWHQHVVGTQSSNALLKTISSVKKPKPVEISELEIPPGWEDKVREEIKRHRADPNYVAVTPEKSRADILRSVINEDIRKEATTPRLAWAILELAATERTELPNWPASDDLYLFGRHFDIRQLEILRSTYLRRCTKNGELLPTGEPSKYDRKVTCPHCGQEISLISKGSYCKDCGFSFGAS